MLRRRYHLATLSLKLSASPTRLNTPVQSFSKKDKSSAVNPVPALSFDAPPPAPPPCAGAALTTDEGFSGGVAVRPKSPNPALDGFESGAAAIEVGFSALVSRSPVRG